MTAISLLLAASSAGATVPGQNGKIVFEGPGGSPDIYTVLTDGTANIQLTTNPGPDADPAWSPDGARIVFDSAPDASSPAALWTMNADGSAKNQITIGTTAQEDLYPTWSPDGTKIAFVRRSRVAGGCSQIYTVAPDGANPTALAPGPECELQDLDWSPDGTRIAYYAHDDVLGTQGLYVANADNSAATKIRPDGRSPSWSPGGIWIAYTVGDPASGAGGIIRTTPDGQYQGPTSQWGGEPDWSPDGQMMVYVAAGFALGAMNDAGLQSHTFPGSTGYTRGHDPEWQPVLPAPVPAGYPRPRGAGPTSASLVPAFDACSFENGSHGAPLAFGSCSPPVQSSSQLTVGTPDANGQAAQSVGRVSLSPILGDPGTTADEADVRVRVSVTDVRCRAGGFACDAPLGDYTGALRLMFDLSITDRYNGGLGTVSATGSFDRFHNPLPITVPCAATSDPGLGATCALDTTVEALVPDAVTEGKRSTWALGQIGLWDAGPDGDPGSDDNTLFAVQGVFVP